MTARDKIEALMFESGRSLAEHALQSANDMCRSAMSIAERKGRDVNWDAFTARLGESLKLQHQAMNPAQPKEEGRWEVRHDLGVYDASGCLVCHTGLGSDDGPYRETGMRRARLIVDAVNAFASGGRLFTSDEVISIANETSDTLGNLYRLDFIERIKHESTTKEELEA